MSGTTPSEDLPLDEYLRAALRHAPDHALTPPSGISQAILAAARQVHRPIRPAPEPIPARVPVPRSTAWSERLQQLLSPRWAGSLATALVGALVIGLWIDHDPPNPTVPADRPSSLAVERREATPAATAPTTERDSQSIEATPRKFGPPAAAPAPVAPAVQKASPGDSAPDRRAEAMHAPQPDSTDAARAGRTTAPNAAAELRRVAPEPAPPAAGLAAPRGAATGAKQAAANQESTLTTAPAAPAPGAASPALTLWRRAVAESSARTAIWTWQPANAASPRSFDADGQAWLLRLVQAARGRWTDVAEASDGGAAAELRWWRDDQAVARLRLEAGGLRWLEPSGRIRFAPMEPEALARLREL